MMQHLYAYDQYKTHAVNIEIGSYIKEILVECFNFYV